MAGETELSFFGAELLGSEMLDERLVLDLVLLNLHLDMDLLAQPSPAMVWPRRRDEGQVALGGLSGAPVELDSPRDTGCVVGMVFRRNSSGLRGRLYAELIRNIAAVLGKQGVILSRESRAFAKNELIQGFGPVIWLGLGDIERVHDIWEELSAAFYGGVPVDDFLRDSLRSPREYGITDDFQLAQVEFLLSRLLLKRGLIDEAEALLRDVSRYGPERSPDQGYLAAVAELRLLVERGGWEDLAARGDSLKRALGVIEDGDLVSSHLRAYEMASAIGKEALVTAQLLPVYHREPLVRQRIEELARTHAQHLAENPVALGPKQEIVSLALSIINALWTPEADPLVQGARLSELAKLGRTAARQRGNAIFFCQMLLVEAVAESYRNEANPFVPSVLASHLFRRGGLHLTHEGVSQVVDYLKTLQPSLYAAVSATFDNGLEDGLAFLEAGSALSISELRDLRGAVTQIRDTVSDVESLKDAFDIPIAPWLPEW